MSVSAVSGNRAFAASPNNDFLHQSGDTLSGIALPATACPCRFCSPPTRRSPIRT